MRQTEAQWDKQVDDDMAWLTDEKTIVKVATHTLTKDDISRLKRIANEPTEYPGMKKRPKKIKLGWAGVWYFSILAVMAVMIIILSIRFIIALVS